MSAAKEKENNVLPHHYQLPLCTTRPSYRQGRKLTAVKVYTVNNESNHLLIFGVPALNLRRELKEMFIKFGKLLQFYPTTAYPCEAFTETYHACYERIQSSRIAKKMLDTKNFYGGCLHITYAQEFETIQETRGKLLQRKKDVLFRLKNLKKDDKMNVVNSDINEKFHTEFTNNRVEYGNNQVEYANNKVEYANKGVEYNVNQEIEYTDKYSEDSIPININNEIVNELPDHIKNEKKTLNMGENNFIYLNKGKRKLHKKDKIGKRSKTMDLSGTNSEESLIKNCVAVVDCTSVDREVVSNINEALNYNLFGNEVSRQVESKPLNKIVFNFSKKT